MGRIKGGGTAASRGTNPKKTPKKNKKEKREKLFHSITRSVSTSVAVGEVCLWKESGGGGGGGGGANKWELLKAAEIAAVCPHELSQAQAPFLSLNSSVGSESGADEIEADMEPVKSENKDEAVRAGGRGVGGIVFFEKHLAL